MSGNNDLPVISAAQVAVLATKVETVIENFAEIRGMLAGMSQQYNGLSNVVVQLQEKVMQMERDINDGRTSAFHQGKAIALIKDEVTKHSTIWKLCGGAVGVVLAVAAWNYNMLGSLKDEDHRHERRIIMLELRADRNSQSKSNPELETPR